MRLYLKLAAMALLAFGGQALVSTGALGEAYFVARCYVATVAKDAALEHQLICECERQFAAQNGQPFVAVAYGTPTSL